jgi:hypothetical protein
LPYANNNGVKIYYEVEGEGPPLVLGHGLSGTLNHWWRLGYVDALRHDFRLILFDARGHGRSDKPHESSAYGYVNLFAGARRVGGKAYAYVFDHVPAGWRKDGAVATHAMELPYVFGDWDRKGSLWTLLFAWAKPSGAKSPDPGFTGADRQVSELMMTIWANFARTGNPSIPGVVDWPAWDEATDQYLYITEKPEVRSGFSKVAQK